ncbi:large subunit ribosomal protein L18 [Thermoflavifilum aggregans]|uniref:Large ribosomal subunit protein uL18 n=1 Tax=Thermoflavifilum aggregans TaxID=454188 RepID=A0A2M9CTQ2_9BACT|nr:50S ribosomal protein L18 [Thermoflavifilum aggregans]MBX6380466.1 50S ribosomal protein L18 [Thermoflavifilum aggregans]PJJ75273.1 large subunit ribosomal protein L18 [Thermoflavifilum aggregans]
MKQQLSRREKIHLRIRKRISGTATRPRLSVFRSNTSIYAQLIDDTKGHTLAAASSRDKDIAAKKGTKTEKSYLVGEALAKKALALGITQCVFDRSGYLYHGRVKALAEGARAAGLQF